jgi:Uma2 family endonuclease
MAMPAALRQFTVDELDAFPDDGNRYELLHGVLLVTPQAGLSHQTVATMLAGTLVPFLRDEPGVQVWAPGVIQIRPSIHLEPDILVGRMPAKVARWEAVRDHWLAVEVSGTGSRVYDRDYKRDGYLEVGVAEVWLVDLDLERVFVSRPGSVKDVPHETDLTWRSPAGRELRLDVAALFRGVPKGD